MNKRIMSLILTFTLCLSMLPVSPVTAYAAEGSTIGASGLCDHHTEHTEDCGYAEGTKESPCAHEHGEDCYAEITSCTHSHTEDCYPVMDSGVSGNEASPSDAAEPTECGHVCDAESGCIKEELSCAHEHDEDCGYAAAVEGHDCHYECAECVEQEQAATPTDATEVACTCEAAEDEPHTEDCALYEAPADPTCTCEDKCAADTINAECAVCTAEGADLTACTGQEAPACDCGTGDPAIHATNCPAYVAPENPECSCAEKCAEGAPNVWCDVCGVQGAKACMAEGETATYEGTSVTIDATSLTSEIEANGTGWSFDGIYLTLESEYEFTINGDCNFIVENHGTILDGTFNKLVNNNASGKISGGTFNEKVRNNDGLISDGTFADIDGMGSGEINGGTVNGNVTLMGSSTISDGTFDGTVTLMGSSTISDGIFNGKVENFATVSGGAFNGDVVNWSLGTISKGEFNGTVKNTGMITGGTFDSIEGNGKIILSNEGNFSVEDTSGFSGTVSVDGAEHTHSYSYYEYEPSQTAGKHDLLSICKGCPINKVSRTEEDCTPGDNATCTTPQTCTLCKRELVAVDSTAHAWGDWTKVDNTQHTRTCARNSSHTETVNHTPGTGGGACVCGFHPIESVTVTSDKTTWNYAPDATATLTATVAPEGLSGATYAWTKDGAEVSGATNSTLALSNLNAGSYTYTCTVTVGGFKMAGNTVTVKVEQRNIAGATVTVNDPVTYYGAAHMFLPDQLTVVLDGKTLSENDYKVKGYSNNTNAGEATIIIEGQGNYTGEETGTFTISPKTVNNPTITLAQDSYEYTGSAITPVVSVKDGDNVIPASEYTVEYENNTDVGEGMVKIVDVTGGNYTVSGSTTFQITKVSQATLSITGKPTSITYGDTFTLGYGGGSGSGAVTWSATGSATVDNSGNVIITGVGATTITVTKAEDANYQEATVTWTFTPAKKAVTATVTAQDKTYDGNRDADVSATIADADLVSGDSITISGLTGTFSDANAGENKTVTVNSSNATVTGTNADCYEISYPNTTATISKSTSSVAFNGYDPSRDYDTTALANPTEGQLTITGADYDDVVFTWYRESVAEANKLTAAPRNAGTYVVVATIPESTNTSGSTKTSDAITISPKEVTSPTITLAQDSYEYTGSAIQPAVTVKDGDNVIPASEYTVEYSDNINVGTATVTITDKDGGNYTVSGSTTFQITKVSQAALSITDKPATQTYGNTFTLGYDGGSGEGAVTWSATGSATVDNSGSVTINGVGATTITVTKAEDTNYQEATATWTFTPAKKTVMASVTAQNKTYDGNTTATVTATVADTDLVSGDSITISGLTGTFSDADAGENKTVTVNTSSASVTGTNADCYEINYPSTVTATISKSSSIVAFNGYAPSRDYDTTVLANPTEGQLTITGADYDDVVFTWYRESVTEANKLTAAPRDAGTYYVVATIPESTNTSGSTATSEAITISPKTVNNPTITLAQDSYEYTGNAIQPTVTVKDGETTLTKGKDYEVSYGSNTTVAEGGTVTITFKGNYSGTEVVKTFTITAAASTLTTAPTAVTGLIYTGGDQNLVTAGSASGGTVVYSLTENGQYSSAIPTKKDAGSYTVYYKVQGDENHSDTAVDSVQVSIGKADGSGTVSIQGWTYGETANRPTPESSTNGIGSVSYRYESTDGKGYSSGTAPTNAGSYRVTATFAETTNYKSCTAQATFTIAKASLSMAAAPNASAIEYGQALVSSNLTGGTVNSNLSGGAQNIPGKWSWTDNSIRPTTTGDYMGKATFTPTDRDNYNDLTGQDVTVNVTAASPSIVITASPGAQIPSKPVEVTVTVKNPHDETLDDAPAATLTYKIGDGAEQALTGGSFTIPEGTAIGTVITITAKTEANGKYTAATSTATVTVTNCQHTGTTELKYDASGHWYHCSNCGADIDRAAHSGGTATCLQAAKCSTCGQSHGDVDSTNHTSVSTVWEYDGTSHWHECACGAELEKAAHTGGTATCTDQAVCSVCKQSYGTLDSDNHVSTSSQLQHDSTHHWGICTCGAQISKTEHSGGTATCREKAVCSTCKQPYGDLDSNNHSHGTAWKSDSSGHWHECACGDKADFAAHTPGAAATSTTPQTCTVCGYIIKAATGGGTGGGGGGYTPPSTPDDGGDSDDDTPPATDDGDDTPTETPAAPPSIPVTVPVSGDENTIQVGASVSGTKATIDDIDLSTLNTVIGDHVQTGVVTIDFSTLDVELDTVEIPANVVKQIADAVNDPDNDAESLEIVFTDGTSIEFDAQALGEKSAQAGGLDITISIKHTTDSNLTGSQQQAVGTRPAYDINVTSGGKHISDMGGKITVHAPYELRPGEKPEHIIVYYVDDNGRRERCETSYDQQRKRVNWKTDHLSVYMIGYDESVTNESKPNPGAGGEDNPDTGVGVPTSPDTGDNTPVYVTHTVQSGDTLWAISRKYGCTVSEIVAANSDLIKNPDLIHVGWQLKIPQGGATGADTNTPDAILPDDKKTGVYIVRRGDTLWAISKRYGCTIAEIIALNGELITDPDLIFAGWELKIPQD